MIKNLINKMNTTNKKPVSRTLYMTQLSMLSALIVILTFTPLGFVPIGPIWATIVHIPVIIGAIIMGPLAGAILGLVFGLCSLFKALQVGDIITVTIFVYNPQITIIPRILIGVFAGYTYRLLLPMVDKLGITAITVSAIIGTATNSVLVISGIYLFTPQYAPLILPLIVPSIIETTLAVIIAVPICKALLVYQGKMKPKSL